MDLSHTDTAAARLAELHAHFLQHPATGPALRAAPTPRPGTPLNLSVVDHIRASVDEVIDHTRTANPDAGPIPRRVQDIYAWCHDNTDHAPAIDQQRRDALELRHRLEHAILAGDTRVVRPLRCPACGTVGLHWQAQTQRALCVNLHCARRNKGVHRTWSLARLAYEQTAEKSWRECAT